MKSQSITLKCSHSGSKLVKCKALAKIAVLDPKIIRSENKQQTKRNRTVFKIHYAFPDLKDVKKYGKTKVLKPNSEKCIPTGKYYAVKRSFRAINGNSDSQATAGSQKGVGIKGRVLFIRSE